MLPTLPKELIDMLDLELSDPTQNEYGFKDYYPILDTHLMWYRRLEICRKKVKISKSLSGWYFYGAVQFNTEAVMVQYLINLKRQITDTIIYRKGL